MWHIFKQAVISSIPLQITLWLVAIMVLNCGMPANRQDLLVMAITNIAIVVMLYRFIRVDINDEIQLLQVFSGSKKKEVSQAAYLVWRQGAEPHMTVDSLSIRIKLLEKTGALSTRVVKEDVILKLLR